MIPPLNIHIMEMHQLIHNNVRPRPSIENVSDNMKTVNSQILNQLTQSHNKFISNSCINNGTDNFFIVYPLIFIIVIHMKKLVDYIAKFSGHFFTNLGTSVFGRYLLADLNQSVYRNPLPVLRTSPLLNNLVQIPIRIINQVCQLHLLLLRNNIAVGCPDLLPDNSRRAAQQINKCLIFTMQITEKIFRTLGQAADRYQIDNFTGCCLQTWIFLCQQLQICQISHFQSSPG